MPHHSRRFTPVVFACLLLLPAAVATQLQTVTPVSASVLQKLLPSVEGWTSDTVRAQQVVLSPEAAYTFALVTLTKGDVKVRLQLSDTGKAPDSLTALAMSVMSMPPDFAGNVAGSTIRRVLVKGSPAAELWDPAKGSGEITVVIGGRFVVAVDSSTCQGLDPLRSVLEAMDFKAIEALN